MLALAKRVSLSSKWDSNGVSEGRVERNCTVLSVEVMSGILDLRPARRRWVFTSINWYFLWVCISDVFLVGVTPICVCVCVCVCILIWER